MVGATAKAGATVFVRRDERESRRRAFGELRSVLERGVPITIFPEGTTFSGPGILPFQHGAFRLAAELALPVVPVAIAYRDPGDAWVGDESFLRHFWERLGERELVVRVRCGPELRGSEPAPLGGEAESWIRAQLGDLERWERHQTEEDAHEGDAGDLSRSGLAPGALRLPA